MKLNILHTNDVHSNFENFAKLVSKIEELKDEYTIILDAGDFADFRRIELQGTDGLAAMELLKYACYDAITIGNNEIFNGLDTLKHMSTNSVVPVLSCNLFELNLKDIEGVKRSVILHKNGLRILVIGATPDLGPFNEFMGCAMKDYLEEIRKEVRRNSGEYDVCILLSHLGMDADREIAEHIDGIHVIIGGHFHLLLEEPEIVQDKIIFTSGSFAEHVGLLKLEVNENQVLLLEGRNINTLDCKANDEIIEILKRNKEKAIDILAKPIYSLECDLWHDVVEENPITNLLADALLDVLKCDLSIINSGILNGGIRKGEVSLKKIIELCPSPLNPTSFEMQGKHIWNALQDSLDTEYCYLDGKGPGVRGRYLGRLHVANALIRHDGRNIIDILINGEKLNPEKWYRVASSDAMQRGTGYASLGNNRNAKYNKEYIRETFKEYLNNKSFVKKAFEDRWLCL